MERPLLPARYRLRAFKKSHAALALLGAAGLALAAGCGRAEGDRSEAPSSQPAKAKNVILFIGDGMGVSTVTPVRILAGQMQGQTGEEYVLSWEKFPHLALAKTYNTNQQVPDSAGTATAMLSGVKSKAGFIGVGPAPKRGDCAAALDHRLVTLLEQAEKRGLSTGVVSTARLTHATPASAYAHVPERGWEADADVPEAAREAGCRDIAGQLIDFPYGDGLEVALGGGRANFLPDDRTDPEYEDKKGRRTDGRDLTAEWLKRKGSAYVWNAGQFDAIDPSSTDHLLGLFEPSHMKFEAERADDPGGEPSLAAMTQKAIEMARRNDNGYFLLIEAGRIDHGHHAGIASYALHDGVALAEAVARADEMTSDEDTLIIVTADHSHTFFMAGYPTRGNPILGKVVGNDEFGEPETEPELAGDKLPYTTLGYANGPGAVTALPRPDITDVDTQDPHYRQQALVPGPAETHAGEDVPVYAKGPGAARTHGVLEQNVVYDIMAAALGFEREKEEGGE